MIMTMTILPILLLIILLGIFSARKFTGKFFNITSKIHFTIVFSFIALLLIMTLIVEWLYPRSEVNHLLTQETGDLFEDFSVESSIINGEPIDESRLLEKRTHEVGETLTIQDLTLDYFGTDIWIERKGTNDGIIEEYITEPYFHVNGYNFTNDIEVALPKWDDHTVTFFKQPTFKFKFASYKDSMLLDQFTNTHKSQGFFNGFSSSARSLTVHLIVPKDLEIDGDLDYVNFVEDWED